MEVSQSKPNRYLSRFFTQQCYRKLLLPQSDSQGTILIGVILQCEDYAVASGPWDIKWSYYSRTSM